MYHKVNFNDKSSRKGLECGDIKCLALIIGSKEILSPTSYE